MRNPIHILLIEDDADDIELLEDALKRNGINFILTAINEGDRVSPYLKTLQVLPDIIILDFNLPKLHGKDVLSNIKASARFKNIPLIVLTTSSLKEDILFAENMGANHFITKPATLADFNKAVSVIAGTATDSGVIAD